MTTPTAIHTRESWLHAAIEALRPRFTEVGAPIPEKIHVSVGFSYGAKAESGVVLGQCWARRASADVVNHIFISPELADTARVIDVLIHELIHAWDDCASGHKGAFAEAATRLGLEGPMTATTASMTLAAELICLAETLGEYPHGEFIARKLLKARTPVAPGGSPAPTPRISSGPGTQTTRMIKMVCADDTCPCKDEAGNPFTVRTTAKWLSIGSPKCPVGHTMDAA